MGRWMFRIGGPQAIKWQRGEKFFRSGELERTMRLGLLMVAVGMVAGIVWQAGSNAAENEMPASEPATASQPATTAAAQAHFPYYLLYFNKKDGTRDNRTGLWDLSTISVELHDKATKSETSYFKLHQRPTQGQATVKFLDADGAAVSEDHVYVIHSGEIVTVRYREVILGGGEEITASDAKVDQ